MLHIARLVHTWEVDSLIIRRLLPPSSPVCRSTAWLFQDLQRLVEKVTLLEAHRHWPRDAGDCAGRHGIVLSPFLELFAQLGSGGNQAL